MTDWFKELISELEMTKTELSSPVEVRSEENDNSLRTLSPPRLAFLLDKLNLRNVQLARSLKIDSSLVSRWRNGKRKLYVDNPLHKALVCYFSRNLFALGKTLAPPSTDLFKDAERFSLVLFHWLFPLPGERQTTPFAINALLKQMLHLAQHTPSLEIPSHDKLETLLANNAYMKQYFTSGSTSNKRYYEGTEGMRAAVIRFLFEVVSSKDICHLKLFSNQNINWLTGDKDFFKAWTLLMQVLLQQGHEIEIIHYLGRSLLEIIQGIKSWLPIYTMGKITPYSSSFYKSPQNDNPMVQTLFINSGKAAVSSSLFEGTEEQAIYQFLRQKNLLTALERQFDYLKERSVRIGHTFRGNKAIQESRKSLSPSLRSKVSDSSLLLLSTKIPLVLLPQNVFSSLLSENCIRQEFPFDKSDLANPAEIYQKSKQDLDDFLARGNEFHLVLPKGYNSSDFCLDFFPYADLVLPLKEDCYPHLRQALTESCSKKCGIHLHTPAESPFPASSLLILEGSLAQVFFETENPFVFEVREPNLVQAFLDYVHYFVDK